MVQIALDRWGERSYSICMTTNTIPQAMTGSVLRSDLPSRGKWCARVLYWDGQADYFEYVHCNTKREATYWLNTMLFGKA